MSNLTKEEEEALSLQLAMQLQEEWNKPSASSSSTTTGNVAGDAYEKSASQLHANLTEEEKKQLALQEDLDLQLALKLQEGEWEEPKQAKPVWLPPPSYAAPPSYKPDRKEIKAPPTAECVRRLMLDLKEILNSNNPTIHAVPDEDDITSVQALIIGGEGTPYEHGFFHFDMQFPSDYPWAPPKVLIETTDGGTVRFNPNLYSNGKVCLSILGTWQGPSWTEIQTMLSTLLSIQSLMNEKPYHNEPGHEVEIRGGEVQNYNECIDHETLRVAVCGMMENPTCGGKFQQVMDEYFMAHYDFYLAKIEQLRHKDGKPMRDPFGEQRGNFRYGSLVSRLAAIKKKVEDRKEEQKKKEEEEAAKVEEESSSEEEEDEEDDEEGELLSKKQKAALAAAAVPATAGTTTTTTTTTTTATTPSTPTTPAVDQQPAVPSAAGDQPQPDPGSPMAVDPKPAETPAAPESKAAGQDLYSNPSTKMEVEPAGGDTMADFLNKALDNLKSTIPAGQSSFPVLAGDDPDMALALQIQAQMEMDIELAKSLQDEMMMEGGGGYGGGYGGDYRPRDQNREYKAVKAPTLEELKAQSAEQDNPDYDPAIICLICKDSPKTYIVLPSCEQPHIYCFSCAQRSQQTPRDDENRYGMYGRRGRSHHGQTSTITCVLCKSVSKLDPSGGLSALKRRRKRKRDESAPTLCPEHKQELSMFCHDDAELVCLACCSASHKGHKVEPLADAKAAVCKHLEGSLRTLESKWSNLEKFVANIKGKEEVLAEEANKIRSHAKDEFQKLRELLDQKEKEMEESITRIEERKKRHIQNEVEKAQENLDKIPASISVLQSAMEESDPSKFFEQYEAQEEELRHIVTTVSPEVKNEWCAMPRFYTGQLNVIISKLQYVDRPQFYGDPAAGMIPYYDDDEDY